MEHNFEANFFTLLEFLDMASRLEIEAACTRKSAQPLEIICAQGEPAHAVYIVAAGVVEALTHSPDGQQTRSVGFMRRGDFFGDLAVLTSHPRLGTIRACEQTELLQIEKLAFLHLLEKIPKMGAYFSRNLARRLHQTATEAHLNVYALDLSGNLRHFDLLTIFQAITSMGRSGELHLNNSANELIGSFFFREGRVEHARFVHLEGIEAIWQGFVQSCTDGNFTFRVIDQPTAVFNEAHRIELGCTDLLMQGVTRRDVYQALPESLRQMEGRLGRLTESLVWTEPETQGLAERLWELMARRPQPLVSLWRRVNFSSLTFLEVVSHLMTSGQAELLMTPAPENQAESQFLPKP
jgi:CRP-like cAMP-binding protein